MKKNKNFIRPFKSIKARKDKNIPAALTNEVFILTYESRALFDEYEQFLETVGGFNPLDADVEPLTFTDDFRFLHYLSSLTGAVESGVVSQTEWPHQLFASPEDFDDFADSLAAWDGRLTDRQYRMIELLSSTDWPCPTNADAAEALRTAAAPLYLM